MNNETVFENRVVFSHFQRDYGLIFINSFLQYLTNYGDIKKDYDEDDNNIVFPEVGSEVKFNEFKFTELKREGFFISKMRNNQLLIEVGLSFSNDEGDEGFDYSKKYTLLIENLKKMREEFVSKYNWFRITFPQDVVKKETYLNIVTHAELIS